jgi:FtsP/CotA-like multicopper oxidase with cupredoxin domain
MSRVAVHQTLYNLLRGRLPVASRGKIITTGCLVRHETTRNQRMPSPVANSTHLTIEAPATPDETLHTNRRGVLKLGLATMPLVGAASAAKAQVEASSPPPSPPTTPFVVAMPVTPVLPSRPLTDPAFARPPTVAPDRVINPATNQPYEGRGDAHQLRSLNPPQTYFAQRFGAVPPASIHPNLPLQVNFWGSNLGGANLATDKPMTPMPTIVSRYQAGANTAILVRRFNNLPTGAPSGGFGKNSISTHLHNFHSAPDSDGGPCDPTQGAVSENPLTQGRFFFPGQYYDYYYNMKRSGFTTAGTPDGDVRETLGTLWYHDHREAHTAENVYKGLAGFHIVFNEYDTGNEATGFKLPSFPAYDIPIIFTDLAIDPVTLQATIDLQEDGGHLGDKYLVNGKIQPFYNVRKRRYRFRLLDMGPSRFYQLFLTNPDNPAQSIPYWRISNDGNLYEKPLQVTSVKLGVAERADIIVDFAKLTAAGGPAAGATRLWLENRLIQTDPRKPESNLNPAGMAANVLVEFRIGTVATDASRDPALITSFAPITLPPLVTPTVTRTFKWERGMGGNWLCNGQLIDCTQVRFAMKRGRMERWIFQTGGGWAHPIHNHFVEGRIVKRNGVTVGATSQEYCRKDVISLYPGDEVEYWLKATDYVGVYPMHCHNVVHEDYGMMLLFRVDDVGDTNPEP